MHTRPSPSRFKAPLALLSTSALIALSSMNCSGCRGGGEGDNTDPTIVLDVQQSELTYTVGSIVTIEVQGSDTDGDGLTFEYEARTENDISTVSSAMWFTTPNSATFRWTPDSPDVTGDKPIELIFIVKDDRGGYVDRKVTLNIRPGNGDPRFEGSFNELYKDCCEKPLNLEIRVRDDDSESVDLQMESGPTGAEFSPIGKDGSITRGRFLWKPDATQAKQRVHSATFVANDGSSQPVRQNLTIIIPPEGEFGIDLRTDDAFDGICAGENVIEYLKLVPERVNLSSESSAGNPNQNAVLIEAKLTDAAKATYDSIFLDWKLKDPLLNTDPVCEDPSSPECLKKREEERKSLQIEQTESPDGKVSWLVNYELYFEDDEKTYLYRVCAIDNDLDADNPNKIVCSPLGQPMFYSFRTYRNATDTCQEEPAEQFGGGNDDFSTAQRITVDSWDRGFTCAGNPDFYTVEVKPGAKLKPSIVYSPDQDIQVKLYDSAKKDISSQLNVPSCGGIVSAEFEVPSTASESQTYYFEVRGDEAIYHIQTIALVKAPEDACVDDSLEPNDTPSRAVPLPTAPTDYAICTGDDVDLFKVDLTAGDKLDLNMRFPSANANVADITLFKPSQVDTISKTASGDAFTFAFGKEEEPLSYVAKECGTHYMLVFSADGTSAGNYSLESTLGKAACQDTDTFANSCNHSQASAQLVSPDTSYDNLTVCPDGEDWFKRAGSGGLTLLGELLPSEGELGSLSFEIYDQSGEKVATGTPNTDRIDLEYTFPNDDFHYIRVFNNSDDTAATYSMYFTLIAP